MPPHHHHSKAILLTKRMVTPGRSSHCRVRAPITVRNTPNPFFSNSKPHPRCAHCTKPHAKFRDCHPFRSFQPRITFPICPSCTNRVAPPPAKRPPHGSSRVYRHCYHKFRLMPYNLCASNCPCKVPTMSDSGNRWERHRWCGNYIHALVV